MLRDCGSRKYTFIKAGNREVRYRVLSDDGADRHPPCPHLPAQVRMGEDGTSLHMLHRSDWTKVSSEQS